MSIEVPPPRLGSPYRSESEAARAAVESVSGVLDWSRVEAVAAQWIAGVRGAPHPFWALEALLTEYPISSAEGLALMRLAEALLRIPDRDTAIALTADQLGRARFETHEGHGIAAVSSRALALARSLLPDAEGQGGLLRRLGGEAVVAIAMRAVQLLARQFVLGETIDKAIARGDEWRAANAQFRFSYDMLGEGARTAADAQRYFEHYMQAVEAIAARGDPSLAAEARDGISIRSPSPAPEARDGISIRSPSPAPEARDGISIRSPSPAPEARDGISIKLSALFPRYEDVQRSRVMRELVPRVWSLCDRAARAGINLTIDAEESERLELSLDVFEALAQRVSREHPAWRAFGLAVQAYQTRALETAAHAIDIARRHRLRFMVRLVKGAYWDAEVKRAQVFGVDGYPVYTHKHHTDASYLACARLLLAAPDAVYPQLASHNAATIAAVIELARIADAPFELQRLHGMGESVYREVLASVAVPCRVYAPVGEYRDLLAYLVRRLLENGANSSFVHQLADVDVPVAELVRSPLRVAGRSMLPLPAELYGASRPNSRGRDVAERRDRAVLVDALPGVAVIAPAPLDTNHVNDVMSRLHTGFVEWSQREVTQRSAILRETADRLELRLPGFAALVVKEARKTWDDAVAEVRETVDFLRYYAAEAEHVMAPRELPGPTGESNVLRLRPRGVWVAISPWNFPLAIFTGQIAAALVTGNSVAAKPAEQTPAIAAAMIDLFHECGVPADALALCAGDGETVGAALVAHPRTAGVVFTGSTAVARSIARALIGNDDRKALVPLIAETGGVNAMIVDTTALPEQVVDAVVASAFRSTGQRCSALRLLCVHEALSDSVVAMLQGALVELAVGDPADSATDVGPVIDAAAKANLVRQIDALAQRGRHLAGGTLPAHLRGDYVAPCIYEIERIEDADEEIFGPVLQMVRWSGELEPLVDSINALGFGLTLGVQTRIDSRAERIAACARVGNVYVNRSMIGAVVGVQPFGGEGLSGTGPKAGGPHYLPRFCVEQTVTINTAAAGGNAALLGMP